MRLLCAVVDAVVCIDVGRAPGSNQFTPNVTGEVDQLSASHDLANIEFNLDSV